MIKIRKIEKINKIISLNITFYCDTVCQSIMPDIMADTANIAKF